MWAPGTWRVGTWAVGTWQGDKTGETPWDEPEIQPGAFAPLSRASSPISKPFKKRTRQRRERELRLL